MRRILLLIGLLALVLACLAPAAALASGSDDVQALEDEGVRDIIVARDPGLSAAARGDLRAGADVAHVEDLPLANTEVVRAPAGALAEAVAALNAEPGVRYAEPNGIVHAATNDPLWTSLWALWNEGQAVNTIPGSAGADINAPGAWALSTGAGQTVAVVDSGMLATHEDLAGSVWTNPGESGPNAKANVDDDGDGLTDDVHGWNYVAKTNDPTDLEGHGTHVTGILAAAKDNAVGIAGIAPDAKVFSLRALGGAKLAGADADIAAAFDVAGRLGIRIVNASIEEPTFSQAIADAIAAHPETLYVVAAGNGGTDRTGDDNDTTPTYPCSLPQDNVICVGASDGNDRPATFSNFGRTSVDLFAPGVNIDSAYISSFCGSSAPTCYAALDGTSMAAPYVSGTLALMSARNPSLTAAQLKGRLLASVAHPAALAGKSATGGRLDAAAAVAAAAPAAPPPAPPTTPTTTTTTTFATASTSTATQTTSAAAAAPAPAPAAAVPVAAALVAPALGRPALSARTLTARRAITIRFALDRAATVRLTVRRGSRTVASAAIHGRKGANRYVLRTKVGSRRLARGRYRIRLQARSGAAASRAYTVAVTVR